MRTNILDDQDFVYAAEVRPVSSLPGAYSLTVSTRWRRAKDPDAEHIQLQITLDRDGLIALRRLIDEVVT
jgi:hypothetical protein